MVEPDVGQVGMATCGRFVNRPSGSVRDQRAAVTNRRQDAILPYTGKLSNEVVLAQRNSPQVNLLFIPLAQVVGLAVGDAVAKYAPVTPTKHTD